MYSHDALSLYMRKAAGEPFRLSVTDCGMFVGDWVRQCTGADPFQHLRGAYDTKEKFSQAIGGLKIVRFVEDWAISHNMCRTLTPSRGDVGSFILKDNFSVGIFTGTGWAGKSVNGIYVSKQATLFRAYAVPHV